VTDKKFLFAIIFLLLGALGNQLSAQGNSSIIFIENKGQWPEEVKFYADIPGGRLFIENNTLTYSFDDPAQVESRSHNSHLNMENQRRQSLDRYAVKVNFLDADSEVIPVGIEPNSTKYNYFIGNDEAKWVSGARSYSKVVIEEMYPGIDLEISADADRLKYDLKLAPGANPACIQMQYKGATSLEIADETLKIGTPYQMLTENIPASYALCNDITRDLKSSYRLTGETVSFQISTVDPEETVVIDPLLVFSTYSGSAADNWGNTATYDDNGNGYAGGMTNQERPVGTYIGDFPATPGAYQTASAGGWDVAILKFDSAGRDLLYATHLGGSGTEVPQSLIVNDAGELLILGITGSSNFPVATTGYDTTFNGGTPHTLIGGVNFLTGSDLFIAKLSADGSQLLASTFLGGSDNDGRLLGTDDLARNYGDESRGDINFDSQGNIIVASRTASADFPMVQGYDTIYSGGATDGLLFKLSSALDSLQWSTFIGGSGSDVVLSLKPDSLDNIFIAGGTTSADFPVSANAYKPTYAGNVDGWVAHIYAAGDSMISSSFIGTTDYDQTFFLDLDEKEDVYLAGQTSGNYLHTSGVYASGHSGQFIHKLTNNLQSTLFSTTINQTGSNSPAISLTAFLVNECDNIYLAGWGSNAGSFISPNNFYLNTNGLPITQDAFQQISDGSSFYLMVLSGDVSELLYATHLGDANSLVHVDGGTSRFDKHGIVYHSVCASCFGDSSFPTTENAYARQNGSIGCNNALFKFDLASLRARLRSNSLALDQPNLLGGCEPLKVAFENFSTGGEIYEWDFGDGGTSVTTTLDTVVYEFLKAGTYQIELRAFDPNTCIAEDFAYTTIVVSDPGFSVSDEASICAGSSTQLLATGGVAYLWSPADGLNDTTIANPIASPEDTTTYHVQITNINECNYTDSVRVIVLTDIIPQIQIDQIAQCDGTRRISVINESQHARDVIWDMGDGTVLNEWEPVYEYTQDGEYRVVATLTNEECTVLDIHNVLIQKLHMPNVLTRNGDGKNDALKITASGPVDITIYTRWGTTIYSQENYQNDWLGEGLTSGIYYYEVVFESKEVCNGWLSLLDGN
jgi:gliding motility-associated-like protein